MKTSFKPSFLLAGILAFFTLLLANEAHAQTATINNNTDCEMRVRLVGVVNSNCTSCMGGTVVVGANSSTTYTLSGTCAITHAIGARVKAESCTSELGVVHDPSCTSCAGPTVTDDTFTLFGGCNFFYPVDTLMSVSITCNGTDITVEIDD